MILEEDIRVLQFQEAEDRLTFSVIVEYDGLMYYFKDVRPEEDGAVSYELGVGMDVDGKIQAIEVTEQHEENADEIMALSASAVASGV